MAGPVIRAPRHWPVVGMLAGAALLHALTWVGLGMGAAVFWHSITAFYFQQSYAAGVLPAVVAGLLLAAVALLLLRRAWLASGPAFLAMLATAVMLPRMGTASVLHPLIHPMQLVHWGAMALTVAGCLWLFALTNRALRPA
jgi:hypothetical protein